MRDEDKTKQQLVRELRTLREGLTENTFARIARDESGERRGAGSLLDHEPTAEIPWAYLPVIDEILDRDEAARPIPRRSLWPSIDPKGFSRENVTESGSFDLRRTTLDAFGHLMDAMPMPILLIDISGCIQFVNSAFLNISANPSEMLGASFSSLFPNAAATRKAETLLEKVVTQRKPQFGESLLLVGGKEIWSRMNFRSIRFGNERSILVVIEDLTTEKRELTLNEKYKRLAQIFPYGIAEFAPAKRVQRDLPADELLSLVLGAKLTDGNSQFATLNGYGNLEELRGVPLREILPVQDKDLRFYRSWLQNCFATTTSDSQEKIAQEEPRYFEITLVGNVQNEFLTSFWAIKRDVTERRRVQQALLEKIKTIDELYAHIVQSGKSKAIAEHTAEVAHELRQPLAIIGGFARRMARQPERWNELDMHSRREGFEIIIREIQRLEKILDGLIDFTRRETIQLQRIDPNDLIEEVLRINAERLKEKDLYLEVNLSRELGEVFLDPARFQQVIRNLVSNAIEACDRKRLIRVETGVFMPSAKAQETGELDSTVYFEMKVHNQGNAIPPEQLQKIFDPFYTTKHYGTGIGLTLCKRIVENHGGSISVKSDAEGTAFTVWIPLEPPDTPNRPILGT
ncbi:MAG: ATP-binding protein [Desulfomonilaceae bacterium]